MNKGLGFLQTNKKAPYDRILLGLFIGFVLFGMIMVFSSSANEYINVKSGDLFTFFYKNLKHIGIALTVFLIVLNIKTSFYSNQTVQYLGYVIIVIMMILPFFSGSVNGASRWIKFGGMSLQPIEFMKIFMVICYAKIFSENRDDIRQKRLLKLKRNNFFKRFLNFFGIFLFPIILFIILSYYQKDLGTIIILLFTLGGLSIIVGLHIKILTLLGSLCGVGIIGIVFIIQGASYRNQRIVAWLDPEKYQQTYGYQILQSLQAIGNGSFWGQGLGNSVQKMGYLPEAHTDYAMAIVGEELGFIGVFFIVLGLLLIIYKGYSIAKENLIHYRSFTGYLAFGLTTLFTGQIIIHLGVVTNLFPSKGLTFPFISYGGSSLIAVSIIMALLLRIDFELRVAKKQGGIR